MREIKLLHSNWFIDEEAPLGPQGGFGRVFEGKDKNGKSVAIKKLSVRAKEAGHRELRLAEEMAKKNYAHVITMYDSGIDAESDDYFIVMPRGEYSLKDVIDKKSVSHAKAINILLQIAEGLSELGGTVHRDLNPGNVLYENQSWKISDFGIAKFYDEKTSINTLQDCLKKEYAAPEQWMGEPVTKSSDIYAMGCIGYLLFTDSPPFISKDPSKIKEQHIHKDPPSLAVEPRISLLLSTMLRKSPASRPSVSSVIKQLRGIYQESENAPQEPESSDQKSESVTPKREKDTRQINEDVREPESSDHESEHVSQESEDEPVNNNKQTDSDVKGHESSDQEAESLKQKPEEETESHTRQPGRNGQATESNSKSDKTENEVTGEITKDEPEISETQLELIRKKMAKEALADLDSIRDQLFKTIKNDVPEARVSGNTISLDGGKLQFESVFHLISKDAFPRSGWDVVCGGVIKVTQQIGNYSGRSSNLWFMKRGDNYSWVELAYCTYGRFKKSGEPFAIENENELKDADFAAADEIQSVGQAFKPKMINKDNLSDFIEKWVTRFVEASRNNLRRPEVLPEE